MNNKNQRWMSTWTVNNWPLWNSIFNPSKILNFTVNKKDQIHPKRLFILFSSLYLHNFTNY